MRDGARLSHVTASGEIGGIRLGTCLFTLVEPEPGQVAAYNTWYERDHFYSGMLAMPHCFAGRRWVATRALKALTGAGDGTFLATYWIEEARHDEFLESAAVALGALQAAGRMFDGRTHVHTGFYELASWGERNAGGVSPELALDHPFAGLAASLGGEEPDVGGAAALRVTFEPLPTPGFDVASPPLHLVFLDATPDDCTDDWRHVTGRPVWTRAFVPTVPGNAAFLTDL